jgi:cyclopropane-fatty-acyl-phospholipid synthase
MDSRSGGISPVEANGQCGSLDSLPGSGPAEDKGLAFYRWIFRKLLPGLRSPLRISLWNGEEFTTGPGRPAARVYFRDRWALAQLLLNPQLGFGDAYSDGRIEVEGDLVPFLELVFQALPARPPGGGLKHWLRRHSLGRRANSLQGARKSIHHHYDVGNDFYQLWLDKQLVYTCAYFPTPEFSLEAAQIAKMDHVCRKLQLRPGQTVVEAGCGWGALSLHMARHYGVQVTAYNISHEQVRYARERAQAEGLSDRVRFVEDDYRTIKERCDVFVSVGMLEHVGLANYHDLGTVIYRCLKPTGRGLIHSIGRNRPAPTNAWLEARIFPGAYMPCLREMMAIFEPWNFSVLDVENLRLHYAKTLGHWLQRFDQAADRIEAMFDARFVRAWRLYLASSLAGFTTGAIQLFQVVFAHGTNNDVPWNRSHLYMEQESTATERNS